MNPDIQLTTKTALKKVKAIELWKETKGHISNICRAIGIERKTFYTWLKKDPDFATALLDSEAELNDDIREALIQKCADGDMTAIIFYLKNRHPDFLQRPQTLVQVNNSIRAEDFFEKD
jgi:hypothetical protein